MEPKIASTKPLVRTALPSDNQALIGLIFRSPQAGRVVLGADRSPDFFARAAPYDESRVLVGEDDSGIVGTVACGLKVVLVQGRLQRAAYIFDLAVAAQARGRDYAQRLLAEAETWASEKGADFLYAHVLGGNRAGLRTFEAAGYRHVARLKSRLFPAGALQGPPAEVARPLEEDDWSAITDLVRQEFRNYDLLRLDPAQGLRPLWEGLPGYRRERVWVAGRPPRAVLGLWDYSLVARAVLLRLPPELKLIQALSRLLRRIALPLPAVPAIGQPVRYGLLLGAAGDPHALRSLFLRALAQAPALGLDALLLFHDPRTPPAWARTLGFSGSYHLVAKVLRPGPATTLGKRPLWVDPVDL